MKLPKEILDFMVIYTGDMPEQIEIEFDKYLNKLLSKRNNPRFHSTIDAHSDVYLMFSLIEWSKK